MTFAEQVIKFLTGLHYKEKLPEGISMLNPFRENPEVMRVVDTFYKKFYNDKKERHLILGINPGRLGGGATGIPFTDTKRMSEKCGIKIEGFQTHEPSSVFVYEVIDAFGGPEDFYSKFYISSICPLGFTARGKNGKEINYNYYDSKELTKAVTPFIIESVEQQLKFGIKRDNVFCLGTGKNYEFIHALNKEQKWFDEVIALEHPRFVMQYKTKSKEMYIDRYLRLLSGEKA